MIWRKHLLDRLDLVGFAWTVEERNVIVEVFRAFLNDKAIGLSAGTIDERASNLDRERGDVLKWLSDGLEAGS